MKNVSYRSSLSTRRPATRCISRAACGCRQARSTSASIAIVYPCSNTSTPCNGAYVSAVAAWRQQPGAGVFPQHSFNFRIGSPEGTSPK